MPSEESEQGVQIRLVEVTPVFGGIQAMARMGMATVMMAEVSTAAATAAGMAAVVETAAVAGID